MRKAVMDNKDFIMFCMVITIVSMAITIASLVHQRKTLEDKIEIAYYQGVTSGCIVALEPDILDAHFVSNVENLGETCYGVRDFIEDKNFIKLDVR